MSGEMFPILDGVLDQLTQLRITRDDRPGLWAQAIKLAMLADTSTSARDMPGLSRELRNVMDALWAAQPPLPVAATTEESDELDDLTARRRARGSATA